MDYTLSQHAKATIREREIRAEWIRDTLAAPLAIEPDSDDPQLFHALRPIPEFGGRVLRVIFNRTRTPPHIVTAYFDRAMKGRL